MEAPTHTRDYSGLSYSSPDGKLTLTFKQIKRKRDYPTDAPVHAIDNQGKAICGKPKADGSPCQTKELDPRNGRCSWHGGFKDLKMVWGGEGRKPVPYELKGDYGDRVARMLNAEDLVTVEVEIAMVNALIEELAQQLHPKGIDPAAWSQMARGLNELELVLSSELEDGVLPEGTQRVFDRLMRIAVDHADYSRIHAAILSAADQKAKLVNTEVKARAERRQALEVSDVLKMLFTIVRGVVDLWGPEGAQQLALIMKANIPPELMVHVANLAERNPALVREG